MDGWIKLHRCLLEKAVWQLNDAQRIVFITILLLANHKGKQWFWKGTQFNAEPGQFVTSLPKLSKTSRVSVQSVRTALDNLKKLDFLTYESTDTGRLITVNNWEFYQRIENESTDKSTDDQHSLNRRPTSTKNDKNDKNERRKVLSSEPKVRTRNRFENLTETHMKLARWLRKQILEWKPDAKVPDDVRAWANDMRLMMERDERTEDRIVEVIDWATNDRFWQKNILSAGTLREKFDKLEAQMRK